MLPRWPPSNKSSKRPKKSSFKEISDKYLTVAFVKSLIFDPSRLPWVSYAIIVAELVLNIFIILRVNYTEIDWIAYMQQCESFLNGTTDYSQLRGRLSPTFIAQQIVK